MKTKRELLTKLVSYFAVTLKIKGNHELKSQRGDYLGEEVLKVTCPKVDLFEDAELILEIVPEEYFEDVFTFLLEMSDYREGFEEILVKITCKTFQPSHLKIISLWFDSNLEGRFCDHLYCQIIETDSWKNWICEFSRTETQDLKDENLLQVLNFIFSKSDFIGEAIDTGEVVEDALRSKFFLDCIRSGIFPWNYSSPK